MLKSDTNPVPRKGHRNLLFIQHLGVKGNCELFLSHKEESEGVHFCKCLYISSELTKNC